MANWLNGVFITIYRAYLLSSYVLFFFLLLFNGRRLIKVKEFKIICSFITDKEASVYYTNYKTRYYNYDHLGLINL